MIKWFKKMWRKITGKPKTISGRGYFLLGDENVTFDVESDEDFDPSEVEGLEDRQVELSGFVGLGDGEIEKIGFKPDDD